MSSIRITQLFNISLDRKRTLPNVYDPSSYLEGGFLRSGYNYPSKDSRRDETHFVRSLIKKRGKGGGERRKEKKKKTIYKSLPEVVV